eukprot:3413597-Prymnesium_polylepis.3
MHQRCTVAEAIELDMGSFDVRPCRDRIDHPRHKRHVVHGRHLVHDVPDVGEAIGCDKDVRARQRAHRVRA